MAEITHKISKNALRKIRRGYVVDPNEVINKPLPTPVSTLLGLISISSLFMYDEEEIERRMSDDEEYEFSNESEGTITSKTRLKDEILYIENFEDKEIIY